MSVEPNAVSDPTSVASGEPNQELEKMRAHQTKLLSEAKTAKARVAELEAKEQEREQNLLAEQGKYKEALESEVKKRKDSEAALDAKDKAFAKKIFTKEVQEIALSLGARKDALDDIVKIGDWSSVEIDENFSINQEQLKAQITALTKSKPFYFSGGATPPRDVNTSANGAPASGKKLEDMSTAEIEAQLRASHNKKG